MRWLAINEAFFSDFGKTLPSSCGGKKPLTLWAEEEPGTQSGAGRGEAKGSGPAKRERPGGRAGGYPLRGRYQSTAATKTHARIAAHGLVEREPSRDRVLSSYLSPTQRLPGSAPLSGANRRGSRPGAGLRRWGWERGRPAPRPLVRTRSPSCGGFAAPVRRHFPALGVSWVSEQPLPEENRGKEPKAWRCGHDFSPGVEEVEEKNS